MIYFDLNSIIYFYSYCMNFVFLLYFYHNHYLYSFYYNNLLIMIIMSKIIPFCYYLILTFHILNYSNHIY